MIKFINWQLIKYVVILFLPPPKTFFLIAELIIAEHFTFG